MQITPRRGFIGRLLGSVAGLAIAPSVASASSQSADEAWLQGLTGKHKQMFDVATIRGGTPMVRTSAFLDVYGEAYGMKDADISAIVGVHSSAVTLAFNDTMWAKYELGKKTNENDPATQAPAMKNLWATGSGPTSIARLQQRGVRFLACMRAIRRLSGELATPTNTADQVRADLLANVLPGVTVVPAMIVAVNRAQEAGLSYVYLG